MAILTFRHEKSRASFLSVHHRHIFMMFDAGSPRRSSASTKMAYLGVLPSFGKPTTSTLSLDLFIGFHSVTQQCVRIFCLNSLHKSLENLDERLMSPPHT